MSFRHVESSMEIVEVANKELKVEIRLHNIETRWKEEKLRFVRHRDMEVNKMQSNITLRIHTRRA